MKIQHSAWIWGVTLVFAGLIAAVLLLELQGWPVLPSNAANLLDRGPVVKLMWVLFCVAIFLNGRCGVLILGELRLTQQGLQSDPTTGRIRLTGHGLLGHHASCLQQIYCAGHEGEISQKVSLDAVRSQLLSQEWLVRALSPLMLTLGLIGTILGLSSSLEGLSVSLNAFSPGATVQGRISSANDSIADNSPSVPIGSPDSKSGNLSVESPDPFQSGLTQAVGGMAGAFSTTLLGAALGGVILRLLTASTQQLTDELLTHIEITCETQLVPTLRATQHDLEARRRESLAHVDRLLEREAERLCKWSQMLERTVQQTAQPIAS